MMLKLKIIHLQVFKYPLISISICFVCTFGNFIKIYIDNKLFLKFFFMNLVNKNHKIMGIMTADAVMQMVNCERKIILLLFCKVSYMKL